MNQYFTKNDFFRLIGLAFIIAGQFMNRHRYSIYEIEFETSELTLIGVAIVIFFPLAMRYLGAKNDEHH